MDPTHIDQYAFYHSPLHPLSIITFAYISAKILLVLKYLLLSKVPIWRFTT